MRALRLIVALLLALPMPVYAAQPENKGKDKSEQSQGRGQEGTPPGQQDRTPPGQERAAEAAANRAERAEIRLDRADNATRSNAAEARVERQHPHQERQAQERADRAADHGQVRLARAPGPSRDQGIRGHDAAKTHVDALLKSLNKFDHARWDYNPHDTRGQGNMGKVDMRDPYGFDKDSGREGADRGRAIQPEPEPILDLATLVTIDFMATDYYLQSLLRGLEFYRTMASRYPQSTSYASLVSYYEEYIAWYTSLTYRRLAVNNSSAIDYTFTLGDIPESFEGQTLTVTTSLTSIDDYDSYFVNIYSLTLDTTYIHYDAGEGVVSQTQEVSLTDGGTLTYTYDPPENLIGWTGGYFELSVTVTEPVSGTTYTITYDQDIYLYRCPYGIIYDKTTGKAIAGATVTVHSEDGSVVLLEKASNPNVSNPQTTDATGRYNCKLAIGKKYYLSVNAPGYQEYKSPLFSERWHIVREDVGMTRINDGSRLIPAMTHTTETGTSPGIGSGFIPGK